MKFTKHRIITTIWFFIAIAAYGFMVYKEVDKQIAMIPTFIWAAYVIIVFVFDPYKSQKKRCPECGSDDILFIKEGEYLCQNCLYKWTEK